MAEAVARYFMGPKHRVYSGDRLRTYPQAAVGRLRLFWGVPPPVTLAGSASRYLLMGFIRRLTDFYEPGESV